MNDMEIIRCFTDLESEVEDCAELDIMLNDNCVRIYDGPSYIEFKTIEGAFGYVMGWKARECE